MNVINSNFINYVDSKRQKTKHKPIKNKLK